MLSVRGFGLSAALTLTERRKCAPQCNEASIVELTETWFVVHNVADGNETRTLSVLLTRHIKAAAERPLYCNSQEKTRPEVTELCMLGTIRPMNRVSQSMPPFIEEEELASSSFRLRLRIFQPAADAQLAA